METLSPAPVSYSYLSWLLKGMEQPNTNAHKNFAIGKRLHTLVLEPHKLNFQPTEHELLLQKKAHEHHVLSEWLKKGDTEVPAQKDFADISICGVIDIVVPAVGYADYKTTSVDTLRRFEQHIYAYNYDLQAYIYAEIFGDATPFVWFLQNKRSGEVLVYRASHNVDLMKSGLKKLMRALELHSPETRALYEHQKTLPPAPVQPKASGIAADVSPIWKPKL